MSRFLIPDMSCGHCRATIEKTVRAIDLAASVEVDLDTQSLVLETAHLAEVLAALDDEGYPATPA